MSKLKSKDTNHVHSAKASKLESHMRKNRAPSDHKDSSNGTSENSSNSGDSDCNVSRRVLEAIDFFVKEGYNKRDLGSATGVYHQNLVIEVGEINIPIADYKVELARLFDSFPDYHVTVKKVVGTKMNPHDIELAFTRTGCKSTEAVELHMAQEGTHTGKPDGFGPYPPVDPAGKRFRVDQINYMYFDENMKIVGGGIST